MKKIANELHVAANELTTIALTLQTGESLPKDLVAAGHLKSIARRLRNTGQYLRDRDRDLA